MRGENRAKVWPTQGLIGGKNLRKWREEGAIEGRETKQKHSWRGQLVEGPPGVRGAGVGHTQKGGLHGKVVRDKMDAAQIFEGALQGVRLSLCKQLFVERAVVRDAQSSAD